MSAATTATPALSLESSSSSVASSYATTNSTSTINPSVVKSTEFNAGVSTSSSDSNLPVKPAICRYFPRGICRFGPMCRFSHDLTGGEVINNPAACVSSASFERPTTSRHNWANAPVFIPKGGHVGGEIYSGAERSWTDVGAFPSHIDMGLGGVLNGKQPGFISEICPYKAICPYGMYCSYTIHLELCENCNQFCLHPTDENQRKKHKEQCLQQHEQTM